MFDKCVLLVLMYIPSACKWNYRTVACICPTAVYSANKHRDRFPQLMRVLLHYCLRLPLGSTRRSTKYYSSDHMQVCFAPYVYCFFFIIRLYFLGRNPIYVR